MAGPFAITSRAAFRHYFGNIPVDGITCAAQVTKIER
jgi:hypothetical protein